MDFKKGDRVKIEMRSQAAIEVFRDDRAREKWENAGQIGYVTDVTNAPARNKLIRVGTHPDDKKGDYFFPGDLKHFKPNKSKENHERVYFITYQELEKLEMALDFKDDSWDELCELIREIRTR